MLKFTQFYNFKNPKSSNKNQRFQTLQLKHLRPEIFLTFSYGFGGFEAHLLLKIFLAKKNM